MDPVGIQYNNSAAQSDNQYHYYDIAIANPSNTLYIRFDAGMSATTDQWYLDDIAVTGVPSVPQISISDASAIEGDLQFRFIDSFVSANSGGLTNPRDVVLGPDGLMYVSNGLAGQSTGDSSNFIARFDPDSGAFVDVAFSSSDSGVFFDLPWAMEFDRTANSMWRDAGRTMSSATTRLRIH